jgi:hypothetical protein
MYHVVLKYTNNPKGGTGKMEILGAFDSLSRAETMWANLSDIRDGDPNRLDYHYMVREGNHSHARMAVEHMKIAQRQEDALMAIYWTIMRAKVPVIKPATKHAHFYRGMYTGDLAGQAKKLAEKKMVVIYGKAHGPKSYKLKPLGYVVVYHLAAMSSAQIVN